MKNRPVTHRRSAIATFVIAALIALPQLARAAEKIEKPGVQIHAALEERTKSFCSGVLPSWLASQGGLDDPSVRTIVADCYVGKIRLAVLGQAENLDGTTLSELPSALLVKETGMSLDLYAPLAGRRIWSFGKIPE